MPEASTPIKTLVSFAHEADRLHRYHVVTVMEAAELDGRPVIISGSEDRTIRVWDLGTGTPVGRLVTGHTAPGGPGHLSPGLPQNGA